MRTITSLFLFCTLVFLSSVPLNAQSNNDNTAVFIVDLGYHEHIELNKLDPSTNLDANANPNINFFDAHFNGKFENCPQIKEQSGANAKQQNSFIMKYRNLTIQVYSEKKFETVQAYLNPNAADYGYPNIPTDLIREGTLVVSDGINSATAKFTTTNGFFTADYYHKTNIVQVSFRDITLSWEKK